MKKILFVTAVACMTLASCKKDYTCTCTYNTNSGSSEMVFPMKDVKKKDAKDACNSLGTSYIAQGGTCDFK